MDVELCSKYDDEACTSGVKKIWPAIRGKVVYAPADHFGMNIPGLFYRAKVTRKDKRRRQAVIIRLFEDDDSQYWLPMNVVHRWVQMNQPTDGRCIHNETDSYAVSALMQLKGSQSPFPGSSASASKTETSEIEGMERGGNERSTEDAEMDASNALLGMASLAKADDGEGRIEMSD
ncbi:hypothetical protein BSKO_09583 [Bryopsis sp. KO-2023]|nr:hypothetical protein BSKO_09583 [Bryopsis sp. KO-2023]